MRHEMLEPLFKMDPLGSEMYQIEFRTHRDAVLTLRALKSKALEWWGPLADVKFTDHPDFAARQKRKQVQSQKNY